MSRELPERCTHITITYLEHGYIHQHTGWLLQQGRRIIDRNRPHLTVCYAEQIMEWRYAR
jgi:hypothetical protein